MQITVSIKQDNGETIEIVKEVKQKVIFDDKDIISSIEKEVTWIQAALSPILSEKLLQQHQAGFRGEKNKEKEWQ